MRYLTIKRISQIAWKTVQDAKIQGPLVNVYQVAEYLGIQVKLDDFGNKAGDTISGVLITRGGKAVIGVNKHNHKKRQRFSIAHEIGHYVLGHERQGMFVDKHRQHFSIFYRNSLSSEGTDRQEMEANAFAAALLMPEKFLRQEIDNILKQEENDNVYFDLSGENRENSIGVSDNNNPFIDKLAEKFDVSPMAMTYRIGNLNLFDTL